MTVSLQRARSANWLAQLGRAAAESNAMNATLSPIPSFRPCVSERAVRSVARATPNPSFERTRYGSPLQAFISFSALRALPPRAAQLKR